MKKKMYVIGKYISVLICLIIFFNASLYLVSCIPSKFLYENAKESAIIMKEQGAYLPRSFYYTIENSCDGLMINEAISIDSDNPLESYLLVRKNYKPGTTKVVLPDSKGQLYSYSENNFDEKGNPVSDKEYYKVSDEIINFIDGKVEISQTYIRYYHGYLTIFRPLLVFFNINQIRILMTVVFVCMYAILLYLLYKKIDKQTMLLFLSFFITFACLDVAQSLESSPLFLVIIISMITLLLNIEKYDDSKMQYHLFVTGCFASFFDFLTTPLLSLCLPFIVYIIYKYKNNNDLKMNFIDSILYVAKFALIWLAGYLVTWFSKLLIAQIVCDVPAISSAFNQFLFRTGGKVVEEKYRITQVIIPMTIKVSLIALLAGLFTLNIFGKAKLSFIDKDAIKNNCVIILASLIPVASMFVLRNHTIYHYDLFPYRNLMTILLVIVYLITKAGQKVKK